MRRRRCRVGRRRPCRCAHRRGRARPGSGRQSHPQTRRRRWRHCARCGGGGRLGGRRGVGGGEQRCHGERQRGQQAGGVGHGLQVSVRRAAKARGGGILGTRGGPGGWHVKRAWWVQIGQGAPGGFGKGPPGLAAALLLRRPAGFPAMLGLRGSRRTSFATLRSNRRRRSQPLRFASLTPRKPVLLSASKSRHSQPGRTFAGDVGPVHRANPSS